jgi:glycosyltransferase involved in cell wall biosynthesis
MKSPMTGNRRPRRSTSARPPATSRTNGNLRIAFVGPAFHPERGGAETYTRHIAVGLKARGHDVKVVTSAVAGLPRVDDVDGIAVTRVGLERSRGIVAGARWLPQFMRAAGARLEALHPDIVVAQYSGLWPAARHAYRAGVALVAIVHDLYGLSENLRWRGPVDGFARYLSNDRLLVRARPHAVVTPSEATATAVRRKISTRVIVARPGVDHVPRAPESGRDGGPVIFVGRLDRSKGIKHLVSAFERVRHELGTELVVVGGGPEERRLPAWVTRHENVDDGELDELIRSSTLLVLPSQREGWALVLSEAAARGVPYVAYDVPAVREQHSLIGGGLLVKPGDEVALRRALLHLLADQEQGARLGREGHDAARAQLRWSLTAAAAERAVQSAIQAAGPR